MGDSAQLQGMAGCFAGEAAPGHFPASTGAHDWPSFAPSPVPDSSPFAQQGWGQASPAMASPGFAFLQPPQSMPQPNNGMFAQLADAMAQPSGDDAAMEVDASAELASPSPAGIPAWPPQPHSQTQAWEPSSRAAPTAEAYGTAELQSQVPAQAYGGGAPGEARASTQDMGGAAQGSGCGGAEAEGLDLVLEPCREGCACLLCAMAPGETDRSGLHHHKRKLGGTPEEASQPKRLWLDPGPPVPLPQQALGSTTLLGGVIGAGNARGIPGATPGSSQQPCGGFPTAALGQRPAGDLSARLASLVRNAPGSGASQSGGLVAAEAAKAPSLEALGVPYQEGGIQSSWQAQPQQQQAIVGPNGQVGGLWHPEKGQGLAQEFRQGQGQAQGQAEGMVSWEQQVQGRVQGVLSSIAGVGADLLVSQSQKGEGMQEELPEGTPQVHPGQQGAHAPESSLVPYNPAGASPFPHASGSGFTMPGNLVIPRDLLSGLPDLADLTGLEDLPWLASDYGLDLGALGDLDFGAMEPMGRMLTNGDSAEGEEVGGSGVSGSGGSGSVGMGSGSGGTPEGSPSPSIPRALASLERVRQVASEEGPVEQRLRKRLLALAEAIVTQDEVQASIFTRLLEADASAEGSPMQRVTYYTLKALEMRRRGEGLGSTRGPYGMTPQVSMAVMEFVRAMPYVEFWQLGFNCAVVDAVAGRRRVHILDFGVWHHQWLYAFQRLQANYAATQGASPAYESHRQVQIRFTAVELPPEAARGMGPMCNPQDLQVELALAAAQAGVELQFRVLRTSMEDFDPAMLGGQGGREGGGEGEGEGEEALVVNLATHLETLADASVLRSNPRDTFLRKLVSLRPDVITCGNSEADFNIPFFLKRFELCLDLYGKLFQSFDIGAPRTSFARRMFEERIMALGLTNLVACEGMLLHVRPEGVAKLRRRMRAVGLQPRPQTAHAAEALRAMLLRYPPGFSIRPCCKGGGGVLSWEASDLASYTAWQPAREELD